MLIKFRNVQLSSMVGMFNSVWNAYNHTTDTEHNWGDFKEEYFHVSIVHTTQKGLLVFNVSEVYK